MERIEMNMAKSRYTAKQGAMAAVALFVALAAAPVLANTAQEKVIGGLSSETSTGVGSQAPPREEVKQPGTAASLQVSQELEQGSYQERFIRRLANESLTGAGRKNSRKKAAQSGTPASVQESQELEQGTYQERFIRRLANESLTGAGRKNSRKEAAQSGTPASVQASREPELGTYQERFIRRLAGGTFPRARGSK